MVPGAPRKIPDAIPTEKNAEWYPTPEELDHCYGTWQCSIAATDKADCQAVMHLDAGSRSICPSQRSAILMQLIARMNYSTRVSKHHTNARYGGVVETHSGR
jgi:hypothetical protein